MKNPWKCYQSPAGYYRIKPASRCIGFCGAYVGWFISSDGTVIEDIVVAVTHMDGSPLGAVKAKFIPQALYNRLVDACTC